MKRLGSVVIIALAVMACGANDPVATPDGIWELSSGSLDTEALRLAPTHPITLTIKGAEAWGTAACNGYGGTLNLDEGISISEIGATAMGCIPSEIMDLEQAYLGALTRVTDFETSQGSLVLRGEGVNLEFDAVDPPPTASLTGEVWVLETLVAGETASSVGGDRATFELFSDGSFIGSTGCRDLTGTWIESGPEILLTQLQAHGECSAELAAQDNSVVSVIGDGFRATIEGDRLTVTSMGGEALVYRASE